MCGILGSINKPFGDDVLKLINHRGPDSRNIVNYIVNESPITLAQTRLSIVDLSEAGSQPMVSQCGNYTIIFNGEIYNHNELRSKLPEINFKGHSDTETILYYIAKFGIDSIADFNGIFAFGFLDLNKQKIYLARDHFGVKPLYYFLQNNQFVFSSEIKTILEVIPNISLDVNHLHTFLRLRFCPSPQTLFQNLNKLESGHYLSVDIKNIENYEKKFYSYLPSKKNNISEKDALDEYDYLIHKSVERQLMSDVPIAIMLSGGVDSALLTCIAQRVSKTKFDTYTVGYDLNTNANELSDAKITSSLLGTNHHEIILTNNDFSKRLPDFINMVEEPIGSQSIFPFYYLAEGIHNDSYKVALSGQGIDEAWAGYGRYNFQNIFNSFASPLFNPLKQIVNLSSNDKLRRGINSLSEKDRALRYIESYSFFDSKMVSRLTNQFNKEHNDCLTELIKDKFKLYNLNSISAVDSMMFLDSRLALSDDLLLYTDKLSMQHSLEVRVPFLDVELMKFVESLPDKFKVNTFQNKILHKKLAERHLPKDIIYRKKKGFYIPRKEWFRTEVGEDFKKTIINDNGFFSEFFNKEYILELFNDHQKGRFNYEDQLYSLLNIYFWFKKYIK